MTSLLYAKICVVLTVGIVGLNLHQFFSSYAYVREKVAEFKGFIEENESTTGVTLVSGIFYLFLPGVYLLILFKAQFFTTGLQIVTMKFIISGLWAWWVQKRILSQYGYSRWIHLVSKSDNIVNIGFAAGVAYFLIFR